MSHIPEDRHKHGLVLDYTLEENLVLQRYWQPEFQNHGFIRRDEVRAYAERLIEQYDVRSGRGAGRPSPRSMSGGNQQKAIVAREIGHAVRRCWWRCSPRAVWTWARSSTSTNRWCAQRDAGKAVLLVSLELDEVMNVSDRILVMYEGRNRGRV